MLRQNFKILRAETIVSGLCLRTDPAFLTIIGLNGNQKIIGLKEIIRFDQIDDERCQSKWGPL